MNSRCSKCMNWNELPEPYKRYIKSLKNVSWLYYVWRPWWAGLYVCRTWKIINEVVSEQDTYLMKTCATVTALKHIRGDGTMSWSGNVWGVCVTDRGGWGLWQWAGASRPTSLALHIQDTQFFKFSSDVKRTSSDRGRVPWSTLLHTQDTQLHFSNMS